VDDGCSSTYVPVVQVDLEKSLMASPARAIIKLGVTHSFVSRDQGWQANSHWLKLSLELSANDCVTA